MRFTKLIILSLLVLPSTSLAGQSSYYRWVTTDNKLGASLHGKYLLRWVSCDDFLMDETGTESAPGEWLFHRLRLEPSLEFGAKVRLVSLVDVFNGNILGETSGTGADYLLEPRDDNRGFSSARLRKLYLEWNSGIGVFRLGQQASRWGLGMMANPGEDESLFADSTRGDLVERFAYVTTPLTLFGKSRFARNFYLGLAGDVVFSDENAELVEGDLAWQLVGSLFYKGDELFVGVYAAYRNQTDRDETVTASEPYGNAEMTADLPGGTLEVVALDLFVSYMAEFPWGSFGIAAEGAAVVGSTTRGVNGNSPEELAVRQFGLAFETGLSFKKAGLDCSLSAGYASGDDNSADYTAAAFKFDAGYRIGMILFEDLLYKLSANSAERLAADRAVPPAGIRSVPTNGSITNALYVAPVFTYEPVETLDIQLGIVWAMAPLGLVDGYQSSVVNGGYPANSWGRTPDSKQLGWELDIGIRWNAVNNGPVNLAIASQAGFFFPGGAFETEDGTILHTLGKGRVVLELQW